MKKILMVITCIAMILSTMLLTNDNTVFAASVNDTFTIGDLSYMVTSIGDAITNGEVEITDFDEDSEVTTLTLPATVEYDGKTFDVVSADGEAFDNADKIKTLIVSKNFKKFDVGRSNNFYKMNESDLRVTSSLDTIIVDEENPILKVIDGVAYDMTDGEENFVFFPYNSTRKEFVVPEFIATSSASHADELPFVLPSYLPYLEDLVMPFTINDRYFVENGMYCSWVNEDAHNEGIKVLMIPNAKKKVVLSENIVDMDGMLNNGTYSYSNKAEEFVVDENNPVFQNRDGNLYKGDALMLYPGGRKGSVYKILEGTRRIGDGRAAAFVSNRNLKSIIIPSSVTTIGDNMDRVLSSTSLKSIKIEGNSNITWGNSGFTDILGNDIYYHIYVDNGNTSIKQTIQAKFNHLTDEYFHEIGATPITSISNVKTEIENKKDVKVSWSASNMCDGYEVRRYDNSGKYEVVASTTNTSFVDTTTAYQTAYQYEVVAYNLPVTSSNDVEDPLHAYKTYGVNSQRSSITTPIQIFQGTYVYKNIDGSETSIVKDVEANTSVIQQAPTLPEVSGYVFEKWSTDLTNPEKVDNDFIATAIYKKREVTPDIDTPEDPGQTPEVKPENPTTPETKPESKPNETIPTPNLPDKKVETADLSPIVILVGWLLMTGLITFSIKKND